MQKGDVWSFLNGILNWILLRDEQAIHITRASDKGNHFHPVSHPQLITNIS